MSTETVPTIEVELVQAPERGHHRFGASKLNYVSDCPGWENREEPTEVANKAALEGEYLHNIMELVLKAWAQTPQPLLRILAAVTEANKVEDVQYDYLVFCCKEVERHISRPGARVFLEQKVTTQNPDGSVLNFGYLDVLVIVDRVGCILDYKFGWVPVRHATTNKQGMNYSAGTFQRYSQLDKIGVVFIQPKLRSVTRDVYSRRDLPRLYAAVRDTIDVAVNVYGNREKYKALLNPSDSCTYCKHKVDCSAGLRHTLQVTRSISPLSIPTSLNLDAIRTGEQAALCRYAVEVCEEFLEGIKARAKEVAMLNGGVAEATLPSGEVVRYEIENRKHDRSLGGTLEIVEAFEPIIEPRRLFGCAEFSLGKLEALVAQEIYENTNLPGQAELTQTQTELDAKVASGEIKKTEAKKQMTEARRRLGENQITKEEAKKRFADVLEAQGLLTRPGGEIPVLRRKKVVKQLTQ